MAHLLPGGTGLQAALLVRECAARNLSLDVFVLAPESEAELDLGVPAQHLSRTHVRWISSLVALYRLRKILHASQYDVVHAILARAHLGAPFAVPRETAVVAWRRNLGDHLAGHRLRWRLERAAAARTDVIIANSDPVASYWRATLPDAARKIQVIPNALDDWRFDRTEVDHPDAEQPLLVASVGGLRAVKGHSDLLAAVALVRQARPVTVVIIGEGPERAALDEQARSLGVTLLLPGHCQDTREWLRRSTVYVQPSRSEGSSNALLEAMAYGCSVVATRTGNAGELLRSCGILVQPGDISSLAHAIDSVLSDPELAAALGRRARSRARGTFTPKRVVEAHLTIYREIATVVTS